MEDIILNFNYKGKEIKIQCKKNENINDILKNTQIKLIKILMIYIL